MNLYFSNALTDRDYRFHDPEPVFHVFVAIAEAWKESGHLSATQANTLADEITTAKQIIDERHDVGYSPHLIEMMVKRLTSDPVAEKLNSIFDPSPDRD